MLMRWFVLQLGSQVKRQDCSGAGTRVEGLPELQPTRQGAYSRQDVQPLPSYRQSSPRLEHCQLACWCYWPVLRLLNSCTQEGSDVNADATCDCLLF